VKGIVQIKYGQGHLLFDSETATVAFPPHPVKKNQYSQNQIDREDQIGEHAQVRAWPGLGET
jgi:hypothetical protein